MSFKYLMSSSLASVLSAIAAVLAAVAAPLSAIFPNAPAPVGMLDVSYTLSTQILPIFQSFQHY